MRFRRLLLLDVSSYFPKIKETEGQKFGRLILEESLSMIIGRIVSAYTDSAEQRYKVFLHSFEKLQQRIPQYHIAAFIGVTPQSLSRIRKKMSAS